MNAPPIDSRSAYADALRWGFETAWAQGARRIVCADPDFGHWPWHDAALLARLGDWLRLPQRRLVLLARHYDDVPRRFPRFTAWRRDWTHAIDCWQPTADAAGDAPSVLISDTGVSVRLVDAVHWRGRASDDERVAGPLREHVDALLQRSEPAFSVSTLGL